MIYRSYGNTNKKVSLIGMGTSRLSGDSAKLSSNVELVLKAFSLGINYFDTAPTYASGASDRILGTAFKEMKDKTFYVSSKSMLSMDPTADDVLKRIDSTLKILQIPRITFFHMWSILSLAQFKQIIAPGGPLEGALKAKQEGMIEHICFSAHCSGSEIAEIIESGLFEGITVGYNAINYRYRQEGLEKAQARGLGVAIMNPLAGGLIPNRPDYFKHLIAGENSIVDSAIQFISSNQAVSTIMIGVNCERDLTDAVNAINHNKGIPCERWREIADAIPEPVESLCTMCGYCQGCPVDLPISRLMGSYNEYILSEFDKQHFHQWRKMFHGIYPFETIPCIKCGRCESKCTQHLPIIERIQKINEICEEEAKKQRDLCERYFPRGGYPKTGIYGMSIDAETMLKAYQAFYGGFPDNIAFFDSNPAKWGTKVLDSAYEVLPPDTIQKNNIERIIITAPKYADKIRDFLKDYIGEGTEIDAL